MNYMGINACDLANGPGIRVSVWVSGCSIHCPGCHNPESWDFNQGKPWGEEEMELLFNFLNTPYIQGLTITGGNPLENPNEHDIRQIIEMVKTKLPEKDIWLYTGWELPNEVFIDATWWTRATNDFNYIIENCDVIVDGPYIQEQRDITLPYRGSKNQRLIDVKKTKEKNEIILWKEE